MAVPNFFLLTDCGCRGDFRSASVCRGSREFFQHWAIFGEFLVLKIFFEKGRLERFANFPEIWRWKSWDFGWGLSSLIPEANRTSSAAFRVELLQIQKRNYCKTSPRPSSCGRRFLALSLIFLGHKKSRSGAFWREIWDSFLLGVVWSRVICLLQVPQFFLEIQGGPGAQLAGWAVSRSKRQVTWLGYAAVCIVLVEFLLKLCESRDVNNWHAGSVLPVVNHFPEQLAPPNLLTLCKFGFEGLCREQLLFWRAWIVVCPVLDHKISRSAILCLLSRLTVNVQYMYNICTIYVQYIWI